MCDTFLALSSATRDRQTILAKNSDREPDEAQAVVHIPRKQHHDSTVRCTFIDVPQVPETYSCILSKPFQMWGAEMGVNEFGVAVGNEAVFTKVSHPRRNDGLTGMDMLRLALERSHTAAHALEVIIQLLETHGQDACGGYRNKTFFYHNSFIIADATEGWILETAGRQWAARKVQEIGSISNRLSLSETDRLSAEAKSLAKQKGWWNGKEPFDFSAAYSDRLYTWLGRGSARQSCTREACEAQRGQLTPHDAMLILQTHNIDDDRFTPRKANTGSVCMHRTSLLNPSDTTGSMVAVLRAGQPHTVWLTGTSHPCLSVYVPCFPGSRTLERMKSPGPSPDDSLWWKANQLHRWISKDYKTRRAAILEERLLLQQSFLDAEQTLFLNNSTPTAKELEEFSDLCMARLNATLEKWITGIKVG